MSKSPSTHVDLAATFIDIAGLPKEKWPAFLDGQSLLGQWTDPEEHDTKNVGLGSGKEILNVEYWGMASIEAPYVFRFVNGSTYKTLRIVGSRYSFLYISWCTNQVELYDTLVSVPIIGSWSIW